MALEIFGELERVLSDLYPYRWLVAGFLVVIGVSIAVCATRLGWHHPIVRHPARAALIAVPVGAVLLVGGWYTLSPLWQRSYLEEPSPLEAAAVQAIQPTTHAAPRIPTTQPAQAEPSLPRQTHIGTFAGADDFHFGRGTALLIETDPGVYTLRFENFSVRNGPDLFVYLTPDPSGASISGAINLGELKATDGAFNYDIPPGTDVSQFPSAIVWCRQFATLFAVAKFTML